jgi:hypothetical protein
MSSISTPKVVYTFPDLKINERAILRNYSDPLHSEEGTELLREEIELFYSPNKMYHMKFFMYLFGYGLANTFESLVREHLTHLYNLGIPNDNCDELVLRFATPYKTATEVRQAIDLAEPGILKFGSKFKKIHIIKPQPE